MSGGQGIGRSAELEPGRSRVDAFRRNAAQPSVTGAGYKGLAIHARAEVHEKVGRIAAASLAPGARVLDLAAGSGAMCLRLKDLGFVPTACDLVAENFRLHDQVDFFELNLNQRLPDCFGAMFDCVVATEIIEHIENPRHLLRQCFNALKPEGLLIVSTPNIASPASRAAYVRTGEFRWFDGENYTKDGHITPITLSGLRTMMAETGFAPGEITSVGAVGWKGMIHWKTRLLVRLVEFLARDEPLPDDILVVSCWRPALAA
jgi:2-polyprenyl-3-methyl-5-hydroxy-6-metoxy-1,4-benzoquinol methylase